MLLWMGWKKATTVEILVEKSRVLGPVETLGILRCAQDDGRNLRQEL
jgi:hypothetical protein